jgi:hypothetical protein
MAAEQNNDAERAIEAAAQICDRLKVMMDQGAGEVTTGERLTQAARMIRELAGRRSAAIGEGGLPELPAPAYYDRVTARMSGEGVGFTADQMREFARATVAADRRARGHAAIQEMVDIAQANNKGYGAPQAAQGVKTWRERIKDMQRDIPDIVAANTNDAVIRDAMKAEIADLRVQLARQSQEVPPAEIDDMAFGYCPSGKIGELREFAYALLARAADLRVAPPLSSEQQTKGENDVG